MAKDDKLKALDAAIAQIERQYGKGSVMKLGDNSANMNVETVPTGSLSLDIALGLGGLPKGRIIEIYGSRAELPDSLTQSMRLILSMQRTSVLILTISIFPSRTAESRRSRSPRPWCVPEPSIL